MTETEQVKTDFLSSWQLQDYLSFGYLYLLIVGVVSDSIYYGMLGINIISYSTILDVLLSPIVRLTDSLIFPFVIIILPVLMYFYVKLILRLQEKGRDRAIAAGKDLSTKPHTLQKIRLQTLVLIATCFGIFCSFMGYGFGGGQKQSARIEAGELRIEHQIQFQDGTSHRVMMLGNNSEYVFYVFKGDHTVSVSPIKDSILTIRELSDAEREAMKSLAED